MVGSVPGDLTEPDFGHLGFIHDQETGRRRTVWGLIVVLAYPGHSFVRPRQSHELEDVIAGLQVAWARVGGPLVQGYLRKAGPRHHLGQAAAGLPG